jgi:hypothetical protein
VAELLTRHAAGTVVVLALMAGLALAALTGIAAWRQFRDPSRGQ